MHFMKNGYRRLKTNLPDPKQHVPLIKQDPVPFEWDLQDYSRATLFKDSGHYW